MGLRLLILSVLAYLVARMIRAGLAARGQAMADARGRRQMVRCAGCGVYVLKDRALIAADNSTVYCSPACQK
jgi:hypothetical protein